ncbi:COG3179 Predicted chitinase [uncultured Caudovirales phage]|uniref:COG3179 Predicted chitinase n=1 Tax=uncultured Caudovirales phage TaxID=2100421 RepID=A0A6J5P7P2_9CAUD|nr:COG3179 Predicted chitinase [uncultured Caudovirales phage]
MSLITEAQLAVMIPTNKEIGEWCAALNEMLPKYGITTDKRIAGFISQCAHESMDFRVLQENLNYKEATLLKVFPRYFGPGKENAAEYAGKPEKIANYVYMDKNRSKGGALGNVKDGDGWLFSGKGLKQVTGRANTTAFGKTIGMTAEEAAAYLLTKKGALESALWFWGSRNLNEVADTGDQVRLTKIINGGDIGLADRQARYAKAMAALGGKIDTPAPAASPSVSGGTLRRGSKGDDVKKMQAKLGLTADGDFGPGTEAALKKWQADNGLTADGVAGPKTLAKLLG